MAEDIKVENFGFLNIIIIVLSVYVLGVLVVDTAYELPVELHKLLMYIDNAICLIFFIDFVHDFYHAESKLEYMKWGWIDLLSSIPAVGFLRVGRVFRLIRLLRIIKAFRSLRQLIKHVFSNKAKGTITSVVVLAIMIVIFSSIAILQVENVPEGNIKSAEDALWWAFVTITTVGYGDRYPITTEGRIIAVILMTVGVGLFGIFTGYLARWFVDTDLRTHIEN